MGDLEVAMRCLDLTSLRGDESRADIAGLCAAAAERSHAAVVVYREHVSEARRHLDGTYVAVATVAGDFPAGTATLDARLFDVRAAVDAGAEELDVVLDRRLIVDGRIEQARDEVAMMREIAGALPMKVILETAELQTPERIRGAAAAAMAGGADFVKTSTGMSPAGGATPGAVRALAQTARAFEERSGSRVGIKVAGGIGTAEQATGFVELVREVLGEDWLTPGLFRIGSSVRWEKPG
jgi:deoxyribose-phosphate aldolase